MLVENATFTCYLEYIRIVSMSIAYVLFHKLCFQGLNKAVTERHKKGSIAAGMSNQQIFEIELLEGDFLQLPNKDGD